MNKNIFYVTAAPYCAAGDGITNDRAAIQQAIDDASRAGGGTVVLTAGKTFLSGNLVLRSCVTLHFEDGAELFQSSDPNDYVKPVGAYEYEVCPPLPDYNLYPDIKWSHAWYFNLPLIFAPEHSHDIAVTGRGTIRMMPDGNPDQLLRICPIGFFRVHNFEIADIEITDYHSYAMMPFYSDHGIFRNLTIHNWSYGNGDGICLMNCQHIRVTGCTMFTGDDSVYIFSSYRDPRGIVRPTWWSSKTPQPSIDIEIDHNDLKSNHCKAFGMILWGIDCPDQELVEVRDVYVHDNHLQTVGNWLYNPYTSKIGNPPVTNIRFENNVIDAIEANFFDTVMCNVEGFRSARAIQNGDFENGQVFWSMRRNANEDSVSIHTFDGEAMKELADGWNFGSKCGRISHFDEGDCALFQGLFLRADAPMCFWCYVNTGGAVCRLFVRDQQTQALIASKDICYNDWSVCSFEFSVPANANYHIGIERGDAREGTAYIDNAVLYGNNDNAVGYVRVGTDPQYNWKPLYFYADPDLWK